MPNTIQHKRSTTASAVPTGASLSAGEIAINTADGRLFIKKSDGTVVAIGRDASELNTGTVAAARLPAATGATLGAIIVGTGLGVSSGTVSVSYGSTSSTACVGNDARLSDARTPLSHTHGNITNSGAIGSTANLPIITTTSGVLTTGSFGTTTNTFCQGNDSRLTKTIARFTASDNQPPASLYAQLDTRNSILVLAFDVSTEEYSVFSGVIPENASTANGLVVRINWMGATATSGNVVWGVQFEKMNTDEDADSWSAAATNVLNPTAANATSGIPSITSITSTTIDSLVAGDFYRLRVYRVAADPADSMLGDAQLISVEVQVA